MNIARHDMAVEASGKDWGSRGYSVVLGSMNTEGYDLRAYRHGEMCWIEVKIGVATGLSKSQAGFLKNRPRSEMAYLERWVFDGDLWRLKSRRRVNA